MPVPATRRAALLMVGVGFAVLYGHVLLALVHNWAADDNYSHGFLVVPIALYFAWERRSALREAASQPSWVGLALAIFSMLVFAAGVLGAELFLARVSMLGVLAGAVLFLYGWRHLWILAFPLSFLLLMIPIPAILFNQATFPLQLMASGFGEAALRMAGVPVLREGNVITLANTSLEVAEACSGIRSLVSLVTLAIVYGYVVDRRTWVVAALAFSAVPVAIAANGVRVAGTGIAAHYWGREAALGFFHEFSGWLVFVVASVLLLGVHRLIVRLAAGKTSRGTRGASVPLAKERP